jgi:uncharacterized GH25 family protein
MSRSSPTLKYLILLLFALLLVLPVSLFAAEDIKVKGRVFNEAGPLADAKVYAYSTYADLQVGTHPAAIAATDDQGVYQISLKQGSYFFIARGESKGYRFFAYHGANPIKIGDNKVWIALMANQENMAAEYSEGTTGIEGKILYKGKPVKGAYVSLYKPDSKSFRGLGVKTESAGNDGRFKLGVSPGRYVVQAKKITGGTSNRPAQKGDLYCYNSNNPAEVMDGKTTSIELSCYPITDRAAFATAAVVKDDDIKTLAERVASSASGIRGRVTDPDGKPIANISVLAYQLTAPVTQMYHFAHGTEFSSITDEAGRFFIPIDADGDYGLQARNVLGDGPHRGEVFGLYQGNSRYAVTFKKGTMVENININADKVMQPAKQSISKKSEIVVGTRVGSPVKLSDSVITSDTIWEGEIHITGVISVKRGATLTIRPGTVVKFRRIDRDNNGIGDSEIMVEGRLIAKGTSDNRIVFTSAEEKPKANDWSYLQFISSDPDNVIENCEFEYAYVGVMIHYANLKISDTLFRHNGRGLHYTSSDLSVQHCTFVNNRVGIYLMRFEGDVRIANNEISGNDIGAQFVRQHVNAVDFEHVDQGKEPPHFENNNIRDNRKYNFSLGEGQDLDINVAGNWWGVTGKAAIAEAMYDRSNDSGLGKIFFEPFLKAPVANAGLRNLDPQTKKQQ